MIDLLVKNGTVATADSQYRSCIAIDDGRIVAVGDSAAMPQARRVIDADGLVVMPGLIDGHTHLCEDLSILAEPYETGTQAAAAGGVTTTLLMPWDTPSLGSKEVLDYRKEYARGRTHVDYGFIGTVLANTAADAAKNLPELWDAGVVAIKTLMVTDDPAFPSLDDGQLVDALRILAGVNGLLTVHAENAGILEHNRRALIAAGRIDYLAHEEFRSELSENEAVSRLAYFAENTDARVVVAHMSTAFGVDRTRKARLTGHKVYSEVCGRNLFLSTDDLRERGPWVKTGPPVRSPEQVEALWERIRNGGITHFSSDHAAWTRENKEKGLSNIWLADGGIPQLQETLPLLLNAVNEGRLTLEDTVRLTSYNPSEIYGLRPRKGLLAPGYDADLVLVDLNRTARIEPSMVKAHVGYSAYDGFELTGWPVMTLVRGEVVMENGEIVGSPDHGTFIRRVSH